MYLQIGEGVLLPFLGTVLGASCVFFLRRAIDALVTKALLGFAAGVMVAASFFSLLLPALSQTAAAGRLGFVPAAVGFLAGMLFLLILDKVIPHKHLDDSEEGMATGLKGTTKLFLAVTLHNIPEGMAVGIVFAGHLHGSGDITAAGALALSLGIALQNFPEGAIVSMPLRAEGMSKAKTFLLGVVSGVVEPLGAILTIVASGFFLPLMPYLLSFAAGAMIYVVVEELIPEMGGAFHSNVATVTFALGFTLMMALDVAAA